VSIPNLKIETCVVGELETNCYIISGDQGVLLIDPGSEPEKIVERVTCDVRRIRAIVCTHGHYDHIGAVAYFQRKYNIPAYIHEAEKGVLEYMYAFYGIERFDPSPFPSPNWGRGVGEGLAVLHTPGHSPGGICLYNDEFVLTGDTVFADGYLGRTDLPSGSEEQIQRSMRKVLELPEELKIYPGHGPVSTIAREKKLHGLS
jgi:hydroxyacylglutathione hydrolase